MAIIPLSTDNFDYVTLELHPKRLFASSSSGLTGSVYVFAEHSDTNKDTIKLSAFNEAAVSDDNLDSFRASIFRDPGEFTPVAASGSIVTTGIGAVSLNLIVQDARGNIWNGTTSNSYTPELAPAKYIGTAGPITTSAELATAIANSLNQARLFGTTAATKDVADTSELLRIEEVSATDSTVNIVLADTGFGGNNPVIGTLVDDGTVTVTGLFGGVGVDIGPMFENYFTQVTQTTSSLRLNKQQEILRFEPTNTFTSDTLRKIIISDILFPYYRTPNPVLSYGYSNYHSINFFTGAMVPTCSALIYPAPDLSDATYNHLCPTGSFTFAFHLNPRRTTRQKGEDYPTGTVMHMSSAYAISVVTGSGIGEDGKKNDFRLLLQLSHSADIAPSQVDLSAVDAGTNYFPNDLIFLTPTGSFTLNRWNHVAFAWSATHNNMTGSCFIDGTEVSKFIISSGAINTTDQDFNPLFIGNYFDGPDSGNNKLSQFFNPEVAAIEGVQSHGVDGVGQPDAKLLYHPLNAEIHDVRIYNQFLSANAILTASYEGVNKIDDSLVFYLPPFYTKESPVRQVLETPFQTVTMATEMPFNVGLSFGVDGRDINLQNYCREFGRNNYPRLFFLTCSSIDESTGVYTANQFLWESASFAPMVRARNLLMMPCDDGKFAPNYNLLRTGSISQYPASGSDVDRFVNDEGALDLSLITLRNMISTSSVLHGLTQTNPDGTDNTDSSGIVQEIVGSSPETPGVSPGSGYTILQRTRDNTSNEIVIFDASNLFYGNSIRPTTIKMTDKSLTGSGGEIGITIRDDGRGNLYRADCKGPQAKWNSVGNVLYDEGIMIILSPNIPYIGRDQFQIEFEGIQNLHVLEITIPCGAGSINSSSNPSFDPNIKLSEYASSTDSVFTNISGILFHDDNLNVITRTTLAQPVVKGQSDKYLFRVKIDF